MNYLEMKKTLLFWEKVEVFLEIYVTCVIFNFKKNELKKTFSSDIFAHQIWNPQ